MTDYEGDCVKSGSRLSMGKEAKGKGGFGCHYVWLGLDDHCYGITVIVLYLAERRREAVKVTIRSSARQPAVSRMLGNGHLVPYWPFIQPGLKELVHQRCAQNVARASPALIVPDRRQQCNPVAPTMQYGAYKGGEGGQFWLP